MFRITATAYHFMRSLFTWSTLLPSSHIPNINFDDTPINCVYFFSLLNLFIPSHSPPIHSRPAHCRFSDGCRRIGSASTIVPFDLYLFIHYTKTLSLAFRYAGQYTSRPHLTTLKIAKNGTATECDTYVYIDVQQTFQKI